MQKSVAVLIGLNLLLAAYLAVALTDRASAKRSPSAGSAKAPATFESRATAASAKRERAPEKFSWSMLASSDLRKYAENLRRVGCPEETIKELMLAEVNRRYASQEKALRLRPDDIAPWEKSARYDRRSAETKLRQLLEEKRSLLKELTGVDVGNSAIAQPTRLAGRNMESFEKAFSALPEDKRDQVRAIQESYWAQSDDIKQRTVGYLEPEDRDEFVRIKAERKEALSKILSPRELQDYEMSVSDATTNLRSRMQGFDVTDDEFRKIFDFMNPLDDQYSLSRRNPDPENKEFTTARTQAEKDLQDQIHNVLGDERFTEYQRTRDPVYRAINQIGTEAGVPKDSIVQAYEAQQQLQNESKRIMQDPNLTPEQRTAGLQDLSGRAQQTMQQVFGDKTAQVLQRLPNFRLAERYGLPLNVVPTPPVDN